MKKANRKVYRIEDDGFETEVYIETATRRELLDLLDDTINSWNLGANCDDVFEILYKDGTTEYINQEYDGHKIRRTGIASIVYDNMYNYMTYGPIEFNMCGFVKPAFENCIPEYVIATNKTFF